MNKLFPYKQGPPEVELVKRQHPLKKTVTKWAVGITSAPRKNPTLIQCVNSVISTGFDLPVVFAEPGTDLSGLPYCVETIERPNTISHPRFQSEGRFGVWRNYVQTMADLLFKFPDAEAVFIVQDDMIFCQDLREFLERDLWPSYRSGVVSVYCPNFPKYENAETVGPKRIRDRYLMGACAMIYPRHVVETVLNSPYSLDWKGRARGGTKDPVDKKAADAWIGNTLKKLKLHVHFYSPSLCQHVARHSTVGHGRPVGKRRSKYFPGEDKSTFDVMSGDSIWLRYDLPGGRQRFAVPRGSEPPEPVNIVIPAVDCFDLTEKCLEHIAHGTEKDILIIYVDNGSEAGTSGRVESVATSLGLPVTVIENEQNFGFSIAVNQGIENSVGRDVLILNNDCFVGPSCIDNLHKHLHWHPRTAAVGPLTNDCGMNSIKNDVLIRFGGFSRQQLQGATNEELERICQVERVSSHEKLPFFCTMLHRSAIEKLGMLSTHPDLESGLGADDLWCHWAAQSGWRLLVCYDAFAAHMHSETFRRTGLNRNRMQKTALKVLKVLKNSHHNPVISKTG